MHPQYWVVAFLACCLLTGCGPKATEYQSREGRYRVRLPGTPKEELDLPKEVHRVTLAVQSGQFSVLYEDFPAPESKPEELLERACETAVQNLKGTQVSRKTITLEGKSPGRELVVEWRNGFVRDRIYLVGTRMYHVTASGPKWWVDSSEAVAFLDSFALLPD